MKKLFTSRVLLFAILFLGGVIKMEAQNVTASAIYYPDLGDTYIFHLNGYHGNIQWQKSNDSIHWTDIVGANQDTLLTVIDTVSYYRAIVNDGTCVPFYSEKKKADIMILNPKTYVADTNHTILISDSTQFSHGTLYYIYNDTTTIDTNNIILNKDNYGYLRKVQAASLFGQNLSIDSRQAHLVDLIKQIDLSDSLKIILGTSKKSYLNGVPVQGKIVYMANGVTLKDNLLGGYLDLSGLVLYEGSIGGGNVSATITDGSINFQPTIEREVKIGIFSGIKKFKLAAVGNLNFNADLQLCVDAPIYGASHEVPIFVYESPFFIYGIPFVAELKLVAGFNADMNFTGTVTSGGSGSSYMRFGAEYNKDDSPQWKTIWDHNATYTQDPLSWDMSGNSNTKVYVKAIISTKILNVIGPYFDASAYIDLDANVHTPPPTWDWTMIGGVEGNVGFDMGMLDEIIPNYNQQLFNWSTTIDAHNGSFSNYSPIASFSLTPSIGTPATNFSFDASASSDIETPVANIEVRWDWNNDGTFDTPYSTVKTATHQYTLPANYTVKLEAKDANGNTNFTTHVVKVLNPTQLPVVTTTPATNINKTTANLRGEVNGLGGSQVTQHGHCYSTTVNPTLANTHSSLGPKTTTGSFTSPVTGLLPFTKYYYCAYATNSGGTIYGSQLSFTTLPAITPAVNTTDLIHNITSISATIEGTIGDFSGGTITQYGVCWATTQNPTFANYKILMGALSNPGSFTCSASSLSPATTYYVRAYAINSAGISYGNQLSFTTEAIGACPITVTDIDGNVYNTVLIGNQCWLKENLKVSHYQNGDPILNVTNATTWSNLTTGAYCDYNNVPDSSVIYGKLYNWYSVCDNRNIAPSGWRVPSDIDWTNLTTFLGGASNAADKLKEVGTLHWSSQVTPVTNSSGFTALPGGNCNGMSPFSDIRNDGFWWTSTLNAIPKPIYYHMTYYHSSVFNSYCGMVNGFSIRCLKGDLPNISTSNVTGQTQNSATSGGNIITDGGSAITARGVCWNTTHNPVITGSHTTDGIGAGNFTSFITGLTAYTTYYVRAYATNSYGTAYGNEISFSTGTFVCGTSTVTDIDGNIYNTVQIGNQCWLKENLKTTKFNDGTSIPNETNNTTWASLSTPGYCYYNNDFATNGTVYGALYNWFAVDSLSNGGKNLAPIGWHVATDAEWTILSNYLINNGYGYQGNGTDIAKSLASTSSWLTCPTAGTPGNDQSSNNSSAFTALPAGYRQYNGSFTVLGSYTYLWSSTQYTVVSNSYVRVLMNNYELFGSSAMNKNSGLVVRCVKD